MSTKPMHVNADIVIVLQHGAIDRIIGLKPTSVKILDLDTDIVHEHTSEPMTVESEELLEKLEQRIYDHQKNDDETTKR